MKTYRVSWTEPEVFNAEVEVDDDATKDDIIYEAQRARDHGEVWVDPSDGEMEDISIEEVDPDEDDEEDEDDDDA